MKKLLNGIKKLFRKLQVFVKSSPETKYILKVQEKFLLKSIQQTLQEIPEFDYKKWKERYGDDLFYFLFEQIFRGKYEVIKKRQKLYVELYIEYIKKLCKENRNKLWVDIGCGRGEFIELLKEHNVSYVGVDTNSVNIDLCKQRGLSVVRSEALNFLSALKDNSLIGVSAFHVIEHLNREELYKFIKLCFEKITYGGLIILETVNIRNDASMKNYYLDPTHSLPLMPEFLSMYLEFVGFSDVSIFYLNYEKIKHTKDDITIYPDFSVVGTKSLTG